MFVNNHYPLPCDLKKILHGIESLLYAVTFKQIRNNINMCLELVSTHLYFNPSELIGFGS